MAQLVSDYHANTRARVPISSTHIKARCREHFCNSCAAGKGGRQLAGACWSFLELAEACWPGGIAKLASF